MFLQPNNTHPPIRANCSEVVLVCTDSSTANCSTALPELAANVIGGRLRISVLGSKYHIYPTPVSTRAQHSTVWCRVRWRELELVACCLLHSRAVLPLALHSFLLA